MDISHQNLVNILKTNLVGTWVWDFKKDSFLVDDMMQKIYGLSAAEANDGYRAWREVVHPEDILKCEAILDAAIRNPKNKYYVRYRISRYGIWRWIIASGYAERNELGEMTRILGINILEPVISTSGEVLQDE